MVFRCLVFPWQEDDGHSRLSSALFQPDEQRKIQGRRSLTDTMPGVKRRLAREAAKRAAEWIVVRRDIGSGSSSSSTSNGSEVGEKSGEEE